MEVSHETIARISLDTYNSLPKNGKPTPSEWTILSTIVKSENGKYEVVALGTGSKCIGPSKMSPRGDVLNDSHAEIVCRRALMAYLYDEMLKETSSLLKLNGEKFSIKKGVEFHFFTTHTPCGDASIFPKDDKDNITRKDVRKIEPHVSKDNFEEESDSSDDLPKPKRLCNGLRDIFRTGAKCLPQDIQKDPHENGLNYHIVGPIRTKPGKGDKTLSISCSDKLAKWCYLGVQGCLLNNLLEDPIYLKSFTISTNCPVNKEALSRALYDRFETVELCRPFARKEMLIGMADFKFPFGKSTDKQRPSPCSIICRKTNGGMKVEVAVEGRKHGVPKKDLEKLSSLLSVCKLHLFGKFLQVLNKYNLMKEIDRNQTYSTFKKGNELYNKNWDLVKRESFKIWSVKDKSLLDFYCKM